MESFRNIAGEQVRQFVQKIDNGADIDENIHSKQDIVDNVMRYIFENNV